MVAPNAMRAPMTITMPATMTSSISVCSLSRCGNCLAGKWREHGPRDGDRGLVGRPKPAGRGARVDGIVEPAHVKDPLVRVVVEDEGLTTARQVVRLIAAHLHEQPRAAV